MSTPQREFFNEVENTTQPGVAFNDTVNIIDRLYGALAINFTLDAALELTQTQADYQAVILSDTGPVLTGPQDVVFPDAFPMKLVVNNTAQTLTLKKDGQTGFTLAAGSSTTVACGVTDVIDVLAGLSGGGSGTTGKHSIPIMASGMSPKQTAGCAALDYFAGASGQPDVAYLAFDATTEEHAQFAIPMPKSWNAGTITFEPIWMHPATTTNFGVCWKVRALAVSNDDTVVASFGTAQSSVDTGGTTSDLYTGPESSVITAAGTPVKSDTLLIDIYRDPTDGGDTMAVDAWLVGVRVFYTTDSETDA